MERKNRYSFISCYSLRHSRTGRLTVAELNKYRYIHTYRYIYTHIYIYIRTFISSTVSCLSVYNSQWTNSATHSGPLQQLVTMNCNETPSPTNCHPFLFFKSPTSFQKPSAVVCCGCFLCAFSSIWWRRVWGKVELDIYDLGKVNTILLRDWKEESYKCLRQVTYQVIHHPSRLSHIIYLPVYEGIYRSSSLSRYCS